MDSDGFFKTGDIGYINDKGFVYVVDQKKYTFMYKEHLINPSEIENVIDSIEAVELVSVAGVNAKTLKFAAAIVQKRKGYESLTEQEVVDYVAERLPEHKQLHGGAYFVDRIPLTINDKIDKEEAAKMITEFYDERVRQELERLRLEMERERQEKERLRLEEEKRKQEEIRLQEEKERRMQGDDD